MTAGDLQRFASSRVTLERDGFKVEIEVGSAIEDPNSNEVTVAVLSSDKPVFVRLGDRKVDSGHEAATCQVATWTDGRVELYTDDDEGPFYVSPEMLVAMSSDSKLSVTTIKRALVAYAKACEFEMTFAKSKPPHSC